MDINEIFKKWVQVTGVDPTARKFVINTRNSSVYDINSEIKELAEIDQMDAVMLLKHRFNTFASEISFKAIDILNDDPEYKKQIRGLSELYSMLCDDEIKEYQETLEQSFSELCAVYGICNIDEEAALEIYLNAKKNVEKMNKDVFRKGNRAAGSTEKRYSYTQKIHMFTDINQLLIAVMSYDDFNGITLNCIIDEKNPAFSFFCYIIKDGENVFMISDRSKCSSNFKRNTRSPGRNMEDRIKGNMYPYDLLNLKMGRSFVRIDGTLPAVNEIPIIGTIQSCNENSAFWIACCMELLYNKFLKDGNAIDDDEIVYTGGMVDVPLLTNKGTENFYAPILSKGYKSIPAQPITFDEAVAAEDCFDTSYPRFGHNNWLIDRYRNKISDISLNLADEEIVLLVDKKDGCTSHENGTDHMKKISVMGFDRGFIGTADDIRKERQYIARNSLAEQISCLYEQEVRREMANLTKWYDNKLRERIPFIREVIGKKLCMLPDKLYHEMKNAEIAKNWKEGAAISHNDVETFSVSFNNIREHDCLEVGKDLEWNRRYITLQQYVDRKQKSFLTAMPPAYAYCIKVNCPEAIAAILGMEVYELPELLQHYTTMSNVGQGNNIINTLDPIEHIPNFISEFSADVRIIVAKSEVRELEKEFSEK